MTKHLKLFFLACLFIPFTASAQDNTFVNCEWHSNPNNLEANQFCAAEGYLLYKQGACVGDGIPLANPTCCCQQEQEKPAPNYSCYWQIEDYPSHISRKTKYFITCRNNTVLQTKKNSDGAAVPDSSKCADIPRKIIPGSVANYGCCCYPEVTKGVPPKAPTFTIPEFQVPISTVKLSEVDCTADSSGNYQCTIPWLGEYVSGIYTYALSLAGILAAIMLIAGGILWLISGGDASRVGQAKELILGSVTGLIILMSSYVLLVQINPNLVKFNPLKIGSLKEVDLEPASSEGNPNNDQDCLNCVVLDKKIPSKNGRNLNSDLNNRLVTALNKSNGLAWRVTEAYPASQTHKATCHYNGACVDVALSGSKVTCADVDKFIEIMKTSGLTILNEYTACGGAQTTYATGGHLHVR